MPRFQLKFSFFATVEWWRSMLTSASGQCVVIANPTGDLITVRDSKKKTGDTHLICLKRDLQHLVSALKKVESRLEALTEASSSPLVLMKVTDKSKLQLDNPDMLSHDLFLMYHEDQPERFLVFTESEIIAFIKGFPERKFKKLISDPSDRATLNEEVERFLAEITSGEIDNPTEVSPLRSQIEEGEFTPLLSKK